MPDLLSHIGADSTLRDELVESWDIADLLFFNQTGSTQEIVRSLAEAGAPPWTIVIADQQTAGKGQGGKEWLSKTGTSLMFSMLLRPKQSAALPLIPIRLGLILARAIDSLIQESSNPYDSLTVRLKWPNDLIINNAKFGGILVEGSSRGEENYAVVGIGLNVFRFGGVLDHTPSMPFAFLDDYINGQVDRLRILDRLLTTIRGSLRTAPEDLLPDEVEEYRKRDWLHGRDLNQPLTGKAAGINRKGHLLVSTGDNGVESVMAGSIVLA